MRDEAPSLVPSAAAPPPSLRALQEWLAAEILAARAPSPPACETWLARPRSGELRDRLDLYRGGYPARVAAAVADTYPAVAHLIGAGALHGLVHRYIRALSRHSYNLNDVGAELPAFLARDALREQLAFLPDLAELEWRVARSFHASSSPPLDPRRLAGWAVEDFAEARLLFQPRVAVVRSCWPIVQLWQARETPIEEIDLDLRDRPEIALVHRRGLDVACAVIDASEADCLERLLAGATIGAATAAIGERASAAPAQWFARWAALGLVTACERSALAM